MRSSRFPPYLEIIKRVFRFGLSADRIPGNITIEHLLVNQSFAKRDQKRLAAPHSKAEASSFLFPKCQTSLKISPFVSEIVRTDLEWLIRCREKCFYSAKCVFRDRVFYLRRGNTNELTRRRRVATTERANRWKRDKAGGRGGIGRFQAALPFFLGGLAGR